MTVHPSDDPEALARYVAGECSLPEARAIEAKLDASPERREAVRALQLILAERRRLLHDGSIDAAAALAEVRARVAARTAEASAKDPGGAGGRRMPPWRLARRLAVAASIVAIAAWGWMLHRPSRPAAAGAVDRSAEYAEYATGRGELRQFRLADGTRVTLAADSRLRLTRFTKDARHIWLSGEAYFEVAHDPSRPFHVSSPVAETTVLGTKFGVKAYPSDGAAAVVVREGKVRVVTAAARETHAVLTHGMRAQVIGRQMQVTTVDPDAYLAWVRGELVFVNEPVSEVLASLERWYNIHVEADSVLRNRRVEISFANISVDEALGELALALHARILRSNKQYRLLVGP